MATQVQFRGGTTTEHASFNGAAREVTVDTTKQTLVVQDGTTNGGYPLLRQDLNNLPAGTIASADIGALTANLAFNANAGAVFASDMTISHDGDHATIDNDDGNLYIKTQGTMGLYVSDSDDAITMVNGGSTTLFWDSAPKLATQTYGLSTNITNSLRWVEDSNAASRSWQFMGEDGAYGIFELLCNDSDGGTLDKTAIKAVSGGTVELCHSGSKKIGTLAGGVEITGSLGVGTDNVPGETGIYLGDGTNPAAHVYANGSDHLYVLANAYYSSGWKYQGSGHAASVTIGDGDLVFNTAPTGIAGNAITWAEVFRAKNSNGDLEITNGNVVIGTAGKGIDFSATTSGTGSGTSTTHQILDEYEEGTWTPANTHLAITNNVTASYTKVGRLVVVQFDITFSTSNADTSPVGGTINGLPYQPDDSFHFTPTILNSAGNAIGDNESNNFITYVEASANNRIIFHSMAQGGVATRSLMAGLRVRGTVTYFST